MKPSSVQPGSFRVDDYVAYLGNDAWRGLYLVIAVNLDGSLRLCDRAGFGFTIHQQNALNLLRLLYRPTREDYSLIY